MSKIEFTRVQNDTYGNPRFVAHFRSVICEESKIISPLLSSDKYPLALEKCKQFGGRKFHNRQYGGGIVFQSYNNQSLETEILGNDEENIGKAQRLALAVTSDREEYNGMMQDAELFLRQFNREGFCWVCAKAVKYTYKKEKKLYDGEKFTPYQFVLAGWIVASYYLDAAKELQGAAK